MRASYFARLIPRGVADHIGDRRLVARRHDVHAGNAGNGGELAHQVEAEPAALGGGIARRLQPRDRRVGNDGAEQLLAHPARRLGRAQRRDADQERQLDAVLGEPRHVAPHHAGIHAELRLHELAAGRDLALEAFRLPAGRRIDRHVGGGDEEIAPCRRPCGRSAARPCRASPPPPWSAPRCRSRTPAWRRAGRPASGSSPLSSSRLRMPSAAAAIRSLCSAMRLRSRQVSCRIGSMPFCSRIEAAVTGPRCARAPAPSVTLTASARPLSGAALASRSAASHDTGGAISAVMTKRSAASFSFRVGIASVVLQFLPRFKRGRDSARCPLGAAALPPIEIATMPMIAARSTTRSHPSPTAACWRCRARARASPMAATRALIRRGVKRLHADRAADLEPAGRSADRRRLRRDAGDLRGQPRRVRPGAALHRRDPRRHDPHEGRHLPGAARRASRRPRRACRSCRCAG